MTRDQRPMRVPADPDARSAFLADVQARTVDWYRRCATVLGARPGRCPPAVRQLHHPGAGVCGRPLTDPDSKMRGTGPDCAGAAVTALSALPPRQP